MRWGLMNLGMGPFTRPEWMAEAARTAEGRGFNSLFVGEHFASFDNYQSYDPYLYRPEGELPMTSAADILDPFVTLTWLAAHTSTIRLGTGILILPLHNPLAAAKQIASIDQVSGGRVVFGAGLGWAREEYQAAGVPWERRWSRMDDYVAAMRCLWSTPLSTYHGEFTSFDQVYSYPKPTAGEDFPVFYGGNGDLTLRRVARNGHGWIALNLRPEEAGQKIRTIRAQAEELGRDPQSIEMTMLTSNWPTYTADDLKRFHEIGMHELIALGHPGPPVTENNAAAWVNEVAAKTVEVVTSP
jgi:probable F420-dependent oxidoreductase